MSSRKEDRVPNFWLLFWFVFLFYFVLLCFPWKPPVLFLTLQAYATLFPRGPHTLVSSFEPDFILPVPSLMSEVNLRNLLTVCLCELRLINLRKQYSERTVKVREILMVLVLDLPRNLTRGRASISHAALNKSKNAK